MNTTTRLPSGILSCPVFGDLASLKFALLYGSRSLPGDCTDLDTLGLQAFATFTVV